MNMRGLAGRRAPRPGPRGEGGMLAIVDADAGRAADPMRVEKTVARAAIKVLGHGVDGRRV